MDANNRPTWKRSVILSLVICVVVAILIVWRPIWISPPNFRLTAFLYLPLAWAGLIFLVIAALRQPVCRIRVGVLGIVLNILLSLVISGVVVLLFVFGPSDCSRTSSTSYRCYSSFFYSSTALDFVSLPNFPLMFWSSSSSSSSSFD